jgi:hypothetical protein
VGLDGSFAFAEAVASQVAVAQHALTHTSGTLDFPHSRLQANARDVLLALDTIEVVHVLLKFIQSHGVLPGVGAGLPLVVFLF